MSVRPLPGASYHTIDTFFYSFDHPDLEAAAATDNTASYRPSEKKFFECSNERKYHQVDPRSSSQGRRYRGPPVLLSVIVLCCLAFIASAYWEHFPRLPLPDVPDRHAPLADRLSSAFRTQSPVRALVDEYYDGALEMMCVPGRLGLSVWLIKYLFIQQRTDIRMRTRRMW
jgi:hypothetical protein